MKLETDRWIYSSLTDTHWHRLVRVPFAGGTSSWLCALLSCDLSIPQPLVHEGITCPTRFSLATHATHQRLTLYQAARVEAQSNSHQLSKARAVKSQGFFPPFPSRWFFSELSTFSNCWSLTEGFWIPVFTKMKISGRSQGDCQLPSLDFDDVSSTCVPQGVHCPHLQLSIIHRHLAVWDLNLPFCLELLFEVASLRTKHKPKHTARPVIIPDRKIHLHCCISLHLKRMSNVTSQIFLSAQKAFYTQGPSLIILLLWHLCFSPQNSNPRVRRGVPVMAEHYLAASLDISFRRGVLVACLNWSIQIITQTRTQ